MYLSFGSSVFLILQPVFALLYFKDHKCQLNEGNPILPTTLHHFILFFSFHMHIMISFVLFCLSNLVLNYRLLSSCRCEMETFFFLIFLLRQQPAFLHLSFLWCYKKQILNCLALPIRTLFLGILVFLLYVAEIYIEKMHFKLFFFFCEILNCSLIVRKEESTYEYLQIILEYEITPRMYKQSYNIRSVIYLENCIPLNFFFFKKKKVS